jgi:hypothetical protein
MVEVMFWRSDNTAICLGTTSKWQFDSREEADKFVEGIHLKDAESVSFQEDGEFKEYLVEEV